MLDAFYISDVEKDEYFGTMVGLSGYEGIVDATYCGPMMSSSAYSIVIVTLEDESKADEVHRDFAANLQWNRWVCVSADAAVIAQRGNMVLCLMTGAETYRDSYNAIRFCGWTILEEINNR